jgi:phosphatidylglycerophosphate synthase
MIMKHIRTDNVLTAMQLPNCISLVRLASAPVLLLLAWKGYPRLVLGLLVMTFASDLLDGYLARRFGQVSELGAKLDSVGDFAIYLTLTLAAWWLWPDILRREAPYFMAIILSYTLPPSIAVFKFRQLTSYHTWGAKLAALCVGSGVLLLFAGGPAWPFHLATPASVLAALEEIAITLVLPTCRSNMRSLWHVVKQKQ